MDKHHINEHVHVSNKKMSVKKGYIPFEMQMTARFILDEICFEANITYIKEQIDLALDQGNEKAFEHYSRLYKQYVKE